MASCLDVITYALRQCRVLGSGGVPTSAETADGMTALQSMYDEWRTGGMFGALEDVYLDADDTAEEGKRYYIASGVTLTDATDIYDDGCGNTRQPRDLALYERYDGTTQAAKLYDRTAWVDLLDLESSGEAPLSSRNAFGLAACLATSGGFSALFGADVTQPVVALAQHFRRNVISKHGSTQDTSGGKFF